MNDGYENKAMSIKSMSELVALEELEGQSEEVIPASGNAVANTSTPNVPLTVKERAQRSDAVAKVVVSDDYLEANMCVFAPQFGGKDITIEEMYEALRNEHVKYGIDEETIETIAEYKMYDRVFTVARGDPPEDGEDGSVKNMYEQSKKLVPKTLEDGSVDFRDLGLVVNINKDDVICEITPETEGEAGMNVFGIEIPPKPGRAPNIPIGKNTILSADGTKLYAEESGNLVFSGGKFNVETSIVISEDVCIETGNISFLGDVVVRGGVQESFSIVAGGSITVSGMVSGATLKAGKDITVKGGVFTSSLTSENGNITIAFGENDTIVARGNLVSTSLIGCNIKIEGSLECVRNPGVVVGGDVNVMGGFKVTQLGHKNYIPTIISVGSMTNLVMEKDALEKECRKIDEYIEKLNASIEFLQEKKRSGVRLEDDKEAYITSAIRLKVQKAVEKKPMKARIEEIDALISAKEDLSIEVMKCVYPNVRINLNSFTTTTTSEYGKCRISCGKNDIEFK